MPLPRSDSSSIVEHPTARNFSRGRIGMLKWDDDKFNPPKSLDQHFWHHLQQFSTDWCYMMLTLWNFTSKIHLNQDIQWFLIPKTPPQKIIPLQAWHSRVHLGKIRWQLPPKYIASHGASKHQHHQLNYESSWFYGMVDVLTIDLPMIQHWITSPFKKIWNLCIINEMTKWRNDICMIQLKHISQVSSKCIHGFRLADQFTCPR